MRRLFDDLKKPIIILGIGIVIMTVLICVVVNKKKKDETVSQQLTVSPNEVVVQEVISENQIEEADVGPGKVDVDGVTLLYDNTYGEEYLQNCIFLGDSRIVGMAIYGFIDTNTALAQIGLSHNNAMTTTYKTSTGKTYTFDSYLESHQAKVIYICYGVNGLTQNRETYKTAYQRLVEHVKEMAPNSSIVIQSIWPAKDGGIYRNTVSNALIDEYNEFLYDLAAEEGIYYLDVQCALKGDDGNMLPMYDSGDGLHYNQTGYIDIIEYIVTHPVPGVVPEPNGYEKETFVWANSTGNGAPDSSSVNSNGDVEESTELDGVISEDGELDSGDALLDDSENSLTEGGSDEESTSSTIELDNDTNQENINQNDSGEMDYDSQDSGSTNLNTENSNIENSNIGNTDT